MTIRLPVTLALAALLALAIDTLSANTPDGTDVLEGVKWRHIGPWRGGRVTAVTGVPGKPNLYYMGATGGGVWKTENAGRTWVNLSDGSFKVGTIGAVAVAESDHNVVYVGTGEAPIRGVTTSHGDGVWKSTDGGRSWKHIGLENSGQIANIRVHPQDPDRVYVGVQGQIWGPSEERGVFRSSDGGETWEHVLKGGPQTGTSDLRMDPTNPRVLYAALWNHGRTPWYVHSGGTDGGIFKSTDGGDTWKKLSGGLPEMVGKIAVDVSASNPDRLYALIEAEPEQGGLWRSENGGKTWSLINNHRVLHTRAWYYIHMAADPQDENTVYVLNVPLLKSIDGGKTWSVIRTPHGDHHDHWINPDDSRNMINGNDGGATITFDGGETWSTQANQPTAQIYRVATDNQVPFRVYGGQQDNSAISLPVRSGYGGIGTADAFDPGGGESAHVAFDPDNPRLIYATSINGTLTEYDRDTGLERTIIPYPDLVFGKDSKDLKYRMNWNPPVAVSPHDPEVIYYGTQNVLRSTDRGHSWEEISGDLTMNDPEKQGRNGGPLTAENVGAEFYNTILNIVESPWEPGNIWVGSDDGMVHLSRDNGERWDDVSPPHRGEAMINSIEISPHRPGTVYLAVTAYKLNDFSPYIYKTENYGKRWKRIDKGLPRDTFVRVVREDPAQRGLLYAGTETGMFVSFDDGDHWHSLALNLPPVPITDLSLRQGKLVAATQGRGFWVLDDLFMVQAAGGIGAEPVQVFTAAQTHDFDNRGWRGEDFEARNPSRGVAIYYYLEEAVDPDATAPLSIEILDPEGVVVRRFLGAESEQERCLKRNSDPRRPYKPDYPTAKKGLNQWQWRGDRQGFPCVNDITLFAGFRGPPVPAGRYTVRVSANGQQSEAAFEWLHDPRHSASDEQLAQWHARMDETAALLDEILNGLDTLRDVRAQTSALMPQHPADETLQETGRAIIEAVDEWDQAVIQPMHQTYEDEDAWPTMLAGQVRFLLDVIARTGAPVTQGALDRLADLKSEHELLMTQKARILGEQLESLNQRAQELRLPHVAPKAASGG